MKKFFAIIAGLALCAGITYAQDMKEATDIANAANEALTVGNYEQALAGFKSALTMAEACGLEGVELASTCKGIIPDIILAIAKDNIAAANFDIALAKLDEAIAAAKEYDNADVAEKAQNFIPQVLMKKGNEFINAKDYANAAETFKQLLGITPDNGQAALRLGQALNGCGNVAGAKEAFLTAAQNGQEVQANKQLCNIALKSATASLKAKSYEDAVAAAVESTQYGETPQAYQIAGQASQLAGKSSDAIKYFEQYLAIAPDSKNAGQIAYTIGALYQQAKNNAKAKEFYQKALTDPKYGPEAKKLLDVLK